MRIGIVPCLDNRAGGIYQYSLSVIRALQSSAGKGLAHDFVVFVDNPGCPELTGLDRRHWRVCLLEPRSALDPVRRLVGEGPHRELWRRWRRRLAGVAPMEKPPPTKRIFDPDSIQLDRALHNWIRSHGVELMFYEGPVGYALHAGMPFILPVHDIQHRLNPQFPEVSTNGEWERREYYYRNGARYATLLLADSQVGREDIINCYGQYAAVAEKTRVLPFQPGNLLTADDNTGQATDVRATYRLPEKFLFYPAQFWPHKNHLNLIRALIWLKCQRNLHVHLVLCGSHSGELREQTFEEVMALAESAGISSLVHFLGYVSDSEMAGLYKTAVALVMPTFFGPTNIPVIEAWALGCPVITSDLRGIREQVGDAGLLVDPNSPEALANAMERLWTDDSLRRELVLQGHQRYGEYSSEDFRKQLVAIIDEAASRVTAGQSPRFP